MLIEEPPGYPWLQPWRGRERAAPPVLPAAPTVFRRRSAWMPLRPHPLFSPRGRACAESLLEGTTRACARLPTPTTHSLVGFAKIPVLNVRLLRRSGVVQCMLRWECVEEARYGESCTCHV